MRFLVKALPHQWHHQSSEHKVVVSVAASVVVSVVAWAEARMVAAKAMLEQHKT
jgi:hypothetical protein